MKTIDGLVLGGWRHLHGCFEWLVELGFYLHQVFHAPLILHHKDINSLLYLQLRPPSRIIIPSLPLLHPPALLPPPPLPLLHLPSPPPLPFLDPIQQRHRLPPHLLLQPPIHPRLPPIQQPHLPHKHHHLLHPPQPVQKPLLDPLQRAVPLRFQHHGAVGVRVSDFLPEDARHGGFEGGAEVELVEAEEAAVGVHEAVVVHHACHEAGCEGVAGEEGDGWHWVAVWVWGRSLVHGSLLSFFVCGREGGGLERYCLR